jgi:hypothetical protein
VSLMTASTMFLLCRVGVRRFYGADRDLDAPESEKL